MAILPCQNPEARQQTGISKEECEAAAWAVEPAGQRHRGAAAINQALAQALNNPMPMHLYRIPGIRWLQDLVYAMVAGVRGWLPGITPYCQRYPEECGQPRQ